MKGRKIHPTGEGHSEEYRHLVIFTYFCLHCICFCVSIIKEIQRRQWHPAPVLLPGKSQGWRSLVACSPWGCYESDMTERLHFHCSLSSIGGGNGNPLQYSCLGNPTDGGAGGLPSMGSHRVGHDWGNLAAAIKEIMVCKRPAEWKIRSTVLWYLCS